MDPVNIRSNSSVNFHRVAAESKAPAVPMRFNESWAKMMSHDITRQLRMTLVA